MNHHITLKLADADDFNHLLTLIKGSGFRLLRLDTQAMEIECVSDSFVLSLAEKYLDAAVMYHKASTGSIPDNKRVFSYFKAVTGWYV